MIHVVAVVTTKPGRREAVLTAFRANLPAVRAEAGCLQYVPVVDVPDAGRAQTKLGHDSFMVVEQWESAEALGAHAASPHMAAYGASVKEMVASLVVHVLQEA